MLNNLKFVLIFLILLSYYSTNGLSRSYSAGGVWSVANSNGFTIRQEPERLFCGSLTCTSAVNCEIMKHGSTVSEKCMDYNLRVIDRKSYQVSSYSDDIELFFGPAYARQAEEESRRIHGQVNDQIADTFRNIGNSFPGSYPNNYPNNNGNNYGNNYPNTYPNNYYNDYDRRYGNGATCCEKTISYFMIPIISILIFWHTSV